jgi:hypothetical protein
MLNIPFSTWIANAAAGLTGLYGEVTRQAEVADCSRQTIYDHAHKVQAAVEDAHDGGPTRAEFFEQIRLLRRENAQLRDWLAQAVDFPLIETASMTWSLGQEPDDHSGSTWASRGRCARVGAAWNGSGSRPKRPVAGSSKHSGRARMPGAVCRFARSAESERTGRVRPVAPRTGVTDQDVIHGLFLDRP